LKGSSADHVLLAAASAVLGVPDDLGLLAVVPVYPSEARWAHEHGADALLAQLGAPEILADPERAPIISSLGSESSRAQAGQERTRG
jgi:hypothetical protein